MAYDSELAERVRPRDATEHLSLQIVEPRQSLMWMLHGNMACGVLGDEVIVPLSVEDGDRALAEADTPPLDMTGRPMRGFVVVAGQSIAQDGELRGWVDAGADYASSLPPK